ALGEPSPPPERTGRAASVHRARAAQGERAVSGPVNVLAGMREFATRKEPFRSTEEAGRQYEVAIFAMAALIQAAENVEAWITDSVPDDACGREVAGRELSAAVGRVRGGAA